MVGGANNLKKECLALYAAGFLSHSNPSEDQIKQAYMNVRASEIRTYRIAIRVDDEKDREDRTRTVFDRVKKKYRAKAIAKWID